MTQVEPAVARGHPLPGFARSVLFTKAEAFSACQALADADRALVRLGRHAEATALTDLFELFEERLASPCAACERESAPVGLVVDGQ